MAATCCSERYTPCGLDDGCFLRKARGTVNRYSLNLRGGQNFRFPTDFSGHRYNSADATAQLVIGRASGIRSGDA